MTNAITSLATAAIVAVTNSAHYTNYINTSINWGAHVLYVPTKADAIREVAASGEICKVYGHWWEPWRQKGRDLGGGVVAVNAVYIPNPPDRLCRLCGATARYSLVIKEPTP